MPKRSERTGGNPAGEKLRGLRFPAGQNPLDFGQCWGLACSQCFPEFAFPVQETSHLPSVFLDYSRRSSQKCWHGQKQLSVDPRSFPASQVEFLPLICRPKCSKTHGMGASWAHTSGPGGFWSPNFPLPRRRAVPLQLHNRNQPSENPRWESFPMVVAEPPPKISSQTRAGAVFRERFKEREPKKINK